MVREYRAARYLTLAVLINNAGKVEGRASDKLSDIRAASNSCYNNLITSNTVVIHALSELLRKSAWPRVIMVSSARGSMTRTTNKEVREVKLSMATNAYVRFSYLPLLTSTTVSRKPASTCSCSTCKLPRITERSRLG